MKATNSLPKKENELYQFLDHSHYDLENILYSISSQNMTSYFFFGDMQKNVFYITDNLKEDFGFQDNLVPGFLTAWGNRIVSEKSKELYRQDQESMILEKRTVHDLRYQVRDIKGRNLWIHCYGVLKWDENQSIPLFFSGRITHQDEEFVVDPVTNFPRTYVMLRKLSALENSSDNVRTIGFSFNNITEINNTKGRNYADHLVERIAENLIQDMSSRMSFYRLDGMRCIAVLEPTCKDKVENLIDEMREIINNWYQVMGISVHRTCSFAYMEYCKDFVLPEDFLEQMVLLIKVSKHDSKETFVEYSGDNITKVKRMSKMSLALSYDVMHGMKNFRIVVQPIISAAEEKVIGGEALLRWKFEGKNISPSIFIPMLEKTNLINIVGRWVFEQVVCASIRMNAYTNPFILAFNVSMQQLDDTGFAEYMKETLSKYQTDGRCLVAEMTENFMDEQPEKMFEFVGCCHELGIKLALDDFGNGYSSLRRLLQYPSSVIKLDRTLMVEIMESEDKKNFISSIVYACHRFGKKVCMEGVETLEQLLMIRETGCDMIQGFYYHSPMELQDMYQLLSMC